MKHNNKKDICYQVQDGLAMVCKVGYMHFQLPVFQVSRVSRLLRGDWYTFCGKLPFLSPSSIKHRQDFMQEMAHCVYIDCSMPVQCGMYLWHDI